jgi:8-oxo-dGTP diphosphatase
MANKGGTTGACLSSLSGRGVFLCSELCVKPLRNLFYSLMYRAAYRARAMFWEVQRPILLGVRSLVIRDDQVLLIRHRAGKKPWSLPGGGVDRHERMAEAARREVFEEAGVSVRVERLLGLYDTFHGEYSSYIAVYICTAFGEPHPRESIEIAEVAFFPMQQLPGGLDDGSQRRIEEYVAGKHGISDLW